MQRCGRRLFVTLLLTNKTVRRLPCPFDGDCSAGCLYRCAWRECSRRPHTRATCERRIDAKASSEDTVVDVEVDRCIDENSGSNHGQVALLSRYFTEAPSIKTRDSSQTSLPANQTYRFSQTQGGTLHGSLTSSKVNKC